MGLSRINQHREHQEAITRLQAKYKRLLPWGLNDPRVGGLLARQANTGPILAARSRNVG
jgi:hypothetical protein